VLPNESQLAALLRFAHERGRGGSTFRVADILTPVGTDDAADVAAVASGQSRIGCASSVKMGVRCEAARLLLTAAAAEIEDQH
jgi:hypothetical protein